ncbi:MAG: hypothetical protein A3G34_07380 [Candidatus Lindowbacteria bacterium RIFCSPLOWO2_12_FULL_62_27]|nr:MAG: hypothetical protein A3G34_07380 [Candidatus Lindowbacteria bacterium RIFCSPLOWO2_12_FULL_62_27]OGH61887.1 MAG: hypothetical protein A3I06_09040 [Candidatus Lindowbacteria bacterium RIFCSPLOWO2_02_FULL_62_12]
MRLLHRCLAAAYIIFVCIYNNGWAWDARPADLEEAFLLWASPKAEYAGTSQLDAWTLLTADTAATARVIPKFLGTPSGAVREKILMFCENADAASVGPAFRPHAVPDSPQLGLVLFCLSRAGDTESLPIILEHLSSRRWQVRSAAALSLGYLGRDARAAVPDLIRALSDTAPMVRKSAAYALGQCADSGTVTLTVVEALVRALDDDFFGTRFNAARALALLGDSALAMLAARYDGLSDTARYGVLLTLGRAEGAAGRPMLEKISADTAAVMPLRGIALKGLLDRKWAPADTDLAELRATDVGRGLWGMTR